MANADNVNIPFGTTVLFDDGDWKVTRHLHEEIILHWEFEKSDGLKLKLQYDEFPERHPETCREFLATIVAGERKSIDLTDASNTWLSTTVDPVMDITHVSFWRGSCGGEFEVTIPTATVGTVFAHDVVAAIDWPLNEALDRRMELQNEDSQNYLAGLGIGLPQPDPPAAEP
jgi:hypothetical protein